jgi:hypothetical protein
MANAHWMGVQTVKEDVAVFRCASAMFGGLATPLTMESDMKLRILIATAATALSLAPAAFAAPPDSMQQCTNLER